MHQPHCVHAYLHKTPIGSTTFLMQIGIIILAINDGQGRICLFLTTLLLRYWACHQVPPCKDAARVNTVYSPHTELFTEKSHCKLDLGQLHKQKAACIHACMDACVVHMPTCIRISTWMLLYTSLTLQVTYILFQCTFVQSYTIQIFATFYCLYIFYNYKYVHQSFNLLQEKKDVRFAWLWG